MHPAGRISLARGHHSACLYIGFVYDRRVRLRVAKIPLKSLGEGEGSHFETPLGRPN